MVGYVLKEDEVHGWLKKKRFFFYMKIRYEHKECNQFKIVWYFVSHVYYKRIGSMLSNHTCLMSFYKSFIYPIENTLFDMFFCSVYLL